ncbi:MAG TPA: PadR family transcriptional regulator [Streptosporangiaceae bacterium]|nr:PadR family transcriptional regulator [Streptosporangiaceae bacterium]
MSYVEVLILSHLAKEPAHGYELRQRVEASSGFGLHNNALYPALRRFEEASAVTKTVEPQEGGRPPRHVYAITEVGRELLHDMLAELPVGQAGDEAEFLTRLGQFDLLTPAERCAVLDARLAALSARAAHLARLTEASQEHPWGAVVVGELARRTAAERGWLERLRALGGELPPPEGEPPRSEKGSQP